MKYVNEFQAEKFAENGVLIGEMTPSKETKFLGWKVYRGTGAFSTHIVACVVDSDGNMSCGERIEEKDLHLYID